MIRRTTFCDRPARGGSTTSTSGRPARSTSSRSARRTSPAKKWALSISFSARVGDRVGDRLLDELEPPHLGGAGRHQQPDRADPAVQVVDALERRRARRTRSRARRAARPSRCSSGRTPRGDPQRACRRSPPRAGRCRRAARSRRPAWSRRRCRAGSTAGRRPARPRRASASRSSRPGLVTSRTWSSPVRRPSRTTRLRSKPSPVRRSYAVRPCARHHATTRSRAALPASEASRQSVISTISSQRPGAWKPHTSRPSASVPNEYSSLLR